jgi:hypothetical protein
VRTQNSRHTQWSYPLAPQAWFRGDPAAQRRLAGGVELLLAIRILVKGGEGRVRLGDAPHRSLQALLCSDSIQHTASTTRADEAEGLEEGVEAWEENLLFMVGSHSARPPSEVHNHQIGTAVKAAKILSPHTGAPCHPPPKRVSCRGFDARSHSVTLSSPFSASRNAVG